MEGVNIRNRQGTVSIVLFAKGNEGPCAKSPPGAGAELGEDGVEGVNIRNQQGTL